MSDSFTQSTSPSFCYCLQSLHEWLQPCCYDAGDDVLSLIVHIAQFHPSVLSDWLPLLLTNPEIQRIVMEYITDSTSPTNWRERIGTERMLVEQTWSRWMEDVSVHREEIYNKIKNQQNAQEEMVLDISINNGEITSQID